MVSAEQSGQPDSAHGVLALRCQLQYADVEAFIRSYAVNLSAAGMFIAAKEPPKVGTALRFEIVLSDDRPILRGEGQVMWTARADAESAAASHPAAAAETLSGLGVRFSRLDAASRGVLARALAYKAAHPALFFTAIPDPYASPGYRPESSLHSASAHARPATEPLASPAAPSLAAPVTSAAEEAALQSLLQPTESRPRPTATDAARLLDELLGRRPS